MFDSKALGVSAAAGAGRPAGFLAVCFLVGRETPAEQLLHNLVRTLAGHFVRDTSPGPGG